MTTLVIALGFVAVFGIGIGTGFAIARTHYLNKARLERAVQTARMQGRLDRGADPGGLEPPKPWKD